MRGVSSCSAVSSIFLRFRRCRSYLDVLRHQPVEQVHVCGLEVSEVLELLNWGALHGQKPQACDMISSCRRRVRVRAAIA